MDEVITLEDRIDMDGIRRLHFMSNGEIQVRLPDYAKVNKAVEVGAWHLRAEYRYCGILDVHAEGWPKFRRMVAWPITETMRLAIYDAAKEYHRLFARWPHFAFTRRLPRGIENGVEVSMVSLFEADWALRGSVLVGGDASSALGVMSQEDAMKLVIQVMRE